MTTHIHIHLAKPRTPVRDANKVERAEQAIRNHERLMAASVKSGKVDPNMQRKLAFLKEELQKAQFSETTDASVTVGQKVHGGVGVAGGAGVFGVLTKIDGVNALIRNEEGRTFRVLLKNVTPA